MIRTLKDRMLLRVIRALTRWLLRSRGTRSTFVGARRTDVFILDGIEYTVVQRRLSAPDRYSREELYAMLAIIRREEQRMNWRCPDPTPTKFASGTVTLEEHRNLVLGVARALNSVVNYAPADRQAELNDVVIAAQIAVSRRTS